MMARMSVYVVGIAALLTSRFSVVIANTSSDLLDECSDELTSCNSDSTCSQCVEDDSAIFDSITSDGVTTEFRECIADNVDEDTSTSTCDVYGVIECCSSSDCFENDAFSNLWECFVGSEGCSTETFSCDETSTAATTATLRAAGFSSLMCTVVLVFTFIRMGF